MTLPIQLIAISYGRGASLITRLSIQNIISDFVAAVTVIWEGHIRDSRGAFWLLVVLFQEIVEADLADLDAQEKISKEENIYIELE